MTDQEILAMYPRFVDGLTSPDSMTDIADMCLCFDVPLTLQDSQHTGTLRKMCRAASGMTSEAAELLGILHKAAYRGHSYAMKDVMQEAGDTLFYLQSLCNTIGITLGELANANVVKLSRRYPDGYAHEMDVNRVDR